MLIESLRIDSHFGATITFTNLDGLLERPTKCPHRCIIKIQLRSCIGFRTVRIVCMRLLLLLNSGIHIVAPWYKRGVSSRMSLIIAAHSEASRRSLGLLPVAMHDSP